MPSSGFGRVVRHLRKEREAMKNPHDKNNKTGRPNWITAAVYRELGSKPDTHIAERAGVSVSTVRKYRRQYGIPAFCPGRGGLFR